MIEFLQGYGLWIALFGVFVAMHWFGMGCCGGGHRHRPDQPTPKTPGGIPSEGPDGVKEPKPTQRPGTSCH